jgi:hypothetical protein
MKDSKEWPPPDWKPPPRPTPGLRSFTPDELRSLMTAVVEYQRSGVEDYSPEEWREEYLEVYNLLLALYEAAIDRERNPL